MRILILGDTGSIADEGARNVTRAILTGLTRVHQVLSMPSSHAVKRLVEIRRFRPQIIHTLHGPSLRTFTLLALLHVILPEAAVLASLSHTVPAFERNSSLLRGLRFIRLLSQDPASEDFFARLGFSVQPLPNGVDIERFQPTMPVFPELQLDPDRSVLLHIGHLKPNRGLVILARLNGYRGWQVLIVGSPSMPVVPETVTMLQSAGCILLQEFVEDLPGLYSAADAYAFPVTDPYGAIDMPLSVLEAMACNLPVISTRYKALPRFLPEGNGLYYFTSLDEAKNALDRVMDCPVAATREKVSPFAWEVILQQLEEIYASCLLQ